MFGTSYDMWFNLYLIFQLRVDACGIKISRGRKLSNWIQLLDINKIIFDLFILLMEDTLAELMSLPCFK